MDGPPQGKSDVNGLLLVWWTPNLAGRGNLAVQNGGDLIR
jgi:hypothetical protein